LQKNVNNTFFKQKNKNTTTTNKKQTYKSLPEQGFEPVTSLTAVLSVSSRPPSQLNLTIAVKLFNWFNVMG